MPHENGQALGNAQAARHNSIKTRSGIRGDAARTRRFHASPAFANAYWTLGSHDIVYVIDGPDDASITALGLALAKSGNVRTQTLRAFSHADINRILAEVT